MHNNIDATIRTAVPSDALDIITQLSNAGYEAYLVGGCVRDTLKGQTPHDWDITTSATPEQMKEAVSYHAIDTGIQHGTITFMVEGEPYETTVFRTEGEYSDGRHPDKIEFADTVEADLARRDFTVNAMAWSPDTGLVDPFGGAKDLVAGVLRGVGDPKERFEEDGLRIMRAVRFAAVHKLDIEPLTAKAMHDTLDVLDNVSAERITSEFLKTLGAEDGEHMARILDGFRDVVFKAVPELAALDGMEQNNPNHDRSLLAHSLDTMAALPSDPVLRFVGLVHDIGKPTSKTFGDDGVAHYYGHMDEGRCIVEKMCRRMKMSNEDIERMTFLVGNHDNRPRETEKSARRFLVKMGSAERLDDMLSLMESDIKAHSPEAVDRVMPRFRKACSFIADEQEKSLAMKVSDLAVNGNDLMEMGYASGPALGAALNEMFSLVVDGEMENDVAVLSAYATKVKDELDGGTRRLASNRKSFEYADGTPCGHDIAEVRVDPDAPADARSEPNAEGGGPSAVQCEDEATGESPKCAAATLDTGRACGRSTGDGCVFVSPHVRGGARIAGYYRATPGKRK